MTKKETVRSLRVGAVASLALLVLAWLIVELSGSGGLFSREVRFRTSFRQVQGLGRGAEVRYAGVTVGRVETISFDSASDDRVLVEFAVERQLANRIDENVHVRLERNGLLGDRLLELRRPEGQEVGTPLPEDSLLPAREPFEITPFVEGGEDLFGQVRSIAESLEVTTRRLVAGKGLFGKLLEDEEFGDRTLTDLEVMLARLRELSETASRGEGLVARLAGDAALAEELTGHLRSGARRFDRLAERLEDGHGLLGQALSDDSELARSAQDLRAAAASARALTTRLETARGLVPRLLFDEELADTLLADLQSLVASADSIATKVDAGEGTVGALVNDDSVHDGVTEIVGGVESSWIVRYLLKRNRKKGLSKRVDRILAESPTPNADLLELLAEVLPPESTAEASP
ncbi:MAG: MlaD family protein [Acidobacteriota bacterium]